MYRIIIISLMMFSPGLALSKVVFHSVEQGRQVIVDETYDRYFSRLEPVEMMAKTAGKVAQADIKTMRNKTREVYQQAVMAFSEDEKAALNWYVSAYSKLFKKTYPLLARTPWQFVKLDNYIEGGLPHTRAKSIVLHEHFLQSLVKAKQEQDVKALAGIGSVLIHELVHVAQREKVNPFLDTYRKWGFQKIQLQDNNRWMQHHQLINPDGVNVQWAYPVLNNGTKDWFVPVVTWSEGDGLRNMPEDFRMYAVMVKKNKTHWQVVSGKDERPEKVNLLQMEHYRQAFPGVSSLYHPNEIAADMVVNMVIFDNFVDHGKLDPAAVSHWKKVFTPLRKVMK